MIGLGVARKKDTAYLGHLKKSDVHGSQTTIPNRKCYIKLEY